MVVTPILQLSLVFRLFLSQLINRKHEVMNAAVLIGAFTAVLGSILGALIMALLRNGSQQMGWPAYVQQIIIGIVIVAAVALDQLRHRASER